MTKRRNEDGLLHIATDNNARHPTVADFVDPLQAEGLYTFDRAGAIAALQTSSRMLKKAVMRLYVGVLSAAGLHGAARQQPHDVFELPASQGSSRSSRSSRRVRPGIRLEPRSTC